MVETIVDEVLLEFVKNLGNAWLIPEDDRVPLAFSKKSLLRIPPTVQDQLSYGTELKKRVEKICDYNTRLSSSGKYSYTDLGGRFQIFDCYQSGEAYPTSYHTYTIISEDKTRPFYVLVGNDSSPREPLPGKFRKSPWRRIILCQGSSSMKRSASELYGFEPCEYFEGSWFSYLHGYRHHLDLSQESTSHDFKYFEDERVEMLFQLLYFDYVGETGQSENEVWPHGTLYRIRDSGAYLPFRKAAFTIFVRKGVGNDNNTPMTIVIYSASHLYKKSESVISVHDFGSFSPLVAIFSILLHASWTIGLSWQRLERVMQKLVSQDDHSFMNPEEYVSLMYDDATFSRSRLYFWAIGTLSEFEKVLADYIRQLELFQITNIEPILKAPEHYAHSVSRISELNADFQEHVDRLKEIRKSFESKLERVQRLQDALFTGSSVMEARQSRVLGENVQLLTFVSIFFLPLSFASALLAVPAISKTYPDTNAIIYATCLIGGLSYLIIFNLKRLLSICQRLFAKPAAALGRKDERFPKPEELPLSKWWLLPSFFARIFELVPWNTRSELRRSLGWMHIKRVMREVWQYLTTAFYSLLKVVVFAPRMNNPSQDSHLRD